MEAAFILGNRGEYLITLGRPAEALEPLRRALTGGQRRSVPSTSLVPASKST
jgi:hypothetical protein